MAAAGFFHLANTNLANAGIYKPDRVSCFACHVYLYSWEPNDEPWSEHERHAMQCPFMRGEPTENVPLEGEMLISHVNIYIVHVVTRHSSAIVLYCDLSFSSD